LDEALRSTSASAVNPKKEETPGENIKKEETSSVNFKKEETPGEDFKKEETPKRNVFVQKRYCCEIL
jgi:hypothetical protein